MKQNEQTGAADLSQHRDCLYLMGMGCGDGRLKVRQGRACRR